MRVDELIGQLRSDEEEQRSSACDQLIQAGAEVVGPLVDLLSDPDTKPPHQLSYILNQIGRSAFRPLVDALGAASWGAHWELYLALVGFGVEFVEDYAAALGHASPLVREAAAAGLQRRGPDALPAAPALVSRLDDPDPRVREGVMIALKYIGEGVIPALQEARAQGPGQLRSAALTTLLEMSGEAALSAQDRAAIDRFIRIKLLRERAESVGETLCGRWLAIPGGDQPAILEALDLAEPRPVTMRLGFAVISSDRHGGGTRRQRDSRVFVTPQLDGWTLVVGSWYACWGKLGNWDFLKLDPATEIEVVRELSARFGQAQSYWYDGELQLGGWLVCVDGEVRRWYHESLPEAAIGDRLPVEASLRLPHESAQIPDEERAALDAHWGEPDYDKRLREVYARYGIPPFCEAFDVAAAMSVSPTKLCPQTEVVGHGQLALTPVGVSMASRPAAPFRSELFLAATLVPAKARPGCCGKGVGVDGPAPHRSSIRREIMADTAGDRPGTTE